MTFIRRIYSLLAPIYLVQYSGPDTGVPID